MPAAPGVSRHTPSADGSRRGRLGQDRAEEIAGYDLALDEQRGQPAQRRAPRFRRLAHARMRVVQRAADLVVDAGGGVLAVPPSALPGARRGGRGAAHVW